MRTITIKDLEMSKVLDKKALASVCGGAGVNNVGYETNNAAPRGVIGTPLFARTAILGIYTRANGRHERMVQDVYVKQIEYGGPVRFEPLAY